MKKLVLASTVLILLKMNIFSQSEDVLNKLDYQSSELLKKYGENIKNNKREENIKLLSDFIKEYPEYISANCFLIYELFNSQKYLETVALGEDLLNVMMLESFKLIPSQHLCTFQGTYTPIICAIEAYKKLGMEPQAKIMHSRMLNTLLRSGWDSNDYEKILGEYKRMFEPPNYKTKPPKKNDNLLLLPPLPKDTVGEHRVKSEGKD